LRKTLGKIEIIHEGSGKIETMLDPTTRFLIVDDMSLMRTQLTKLLNQLGYHDIIEAADGAKAFEAVQQSKPPIGVIIADLEMPGSTGMDLLRRLRADSRFYGTPFIMMLLEAEQATLADALKIGISGYLLKPFNLDILREKLSALTQQ
jgi:two-component system, chemotaxis family, chemotaxis protein CheY